MSNILNNRISAAISAQDKAEIKQAIALIESKLPFLLGLTADERKVLPKINRQNKLFVDETIQACADNGAILPAFIKVDEMRKDFDLFVDLGDIALPLSQLYEKVRDTQMLAGSESFSTSLAVYKMFQLAAASGMPGMDTVADKLAERFSGQGTPSEEQPVEEVNG